MRCQACHYSTTMDIVSYEQTTEETNLKNWDGNWLKPVHVDVPIPNAEPFIKLSATHTMVDTVFGPMGHLVQLYACPMCWTIKGVPQ